jgi:hypothetical protein
MRAFTLDSAGKECIPAGPISQRNTSGERKSRLNFDEMQHRLLDRLRERVQNGEITERGVARSAGISQPHIHNVLKGARNFSPELIDLVFKCLDCSVLDLCTASELQDHLERLCAVSQPTFDLPFISSRVGPGLPWPVGVDWQDRNPVPCAVRALGQNLVLARLWPDTDMQSSTLDKNIAVLDLSEIDTYSSDILYVVDRGRDAVLRSIRPGLEKVYLVADADADCPERWESLPTPFGVAPVVRARVCQFGREAERDL